VFCARSRWRGCSPAATLPSPPPPPSTPLILASKVAVTDGLPSGVACVVNENVFFDGPAHFAFLADTLHDGGGDPTICGDLAFPRTRTLDVTYALQGGDGLPWVYWWRGSRDRETGTYQLASLAGPDSVAAGDTVKLTALPLPLGEDDDAVGTVAILWMASTRQVTDSAFVKQSYEGRNYSLQHWREKEAPRPDSARAAGVAVTLWWSNNHRDRPVDSTVVFRNGVHRRTLDRTASTVVDTVPGPGTWTYRLKHVAGPVINDPLVSPNSPSSDSLAVKVGTACARGEYGITWRYADQYLSAGCSLDQGADTRYRWYGAGDVVLRDWSPDTLFDFAGHAAAGNQIVILEDRDLSTDSTSRDTVRLTVRDSLVHIEGESYITDKRRYTYAATAAGGAHAGQWFERYEDGPQWYPATAYDQTSMTRIWPMGDYVVDLRQHQGAGGVLRRGRLVVDVCSSPGCTPPIEAPPMAGPTADALASWGLFGAGPWLGWGGADLRRTVRFYDLWGMPERESPFTTAGWISGTGGQLSDAATGWQVAWTPRDLAFDDVRAFDLAVTGTRDRPYVFSMAVDPDLGGTAADDVASYDAERGLVLVADADGALGFLLRAGRRNALASVQEYGVGRWAPTVPATAWAAQRTPGVHLRGTPRDVQLVLSASETAEPGTWTFVIIRGRSPAAIRAAADAVLGTLR
jgi:hypothetical protein